MLRIQTGEIEAFEELVELFKRPVVSLIYRIVRDLDEAEDIAQNTFIQVYKSADRYTPTAKFSTWLFTIARNLSLNELRRRSRKPAFSLESSGAGEGEAGGGMSEVLEDRHTDRPAEKTMEHELETLIVEALGDLPENQRTALTLYRDNDMSYEDIADVLGCSLSAVKSTIHRARETLKRRLKPYLRSGEWHFSPTA